MPSLADTIASFQRLRGAAPVSGAPTRLAPFTGFGANPGALSAYVHIPAGLGARAPLVVVLHGCTQTAEAYDRGSGWSSLADRFGFALLFPEQVRANNPNLCFNWFTPADTRRTGGEAESIATMTMAMIARHDLDPARVFVTGLSAGGAMASAMLATRPDLFAGGAIIAGLPYGVAAGVPQALERMQGRGHDRAALSRSVRDASAHTGPWPTISVWHGDADATVNPVNAAMILEQWRGLHGVGADASVTDRIGAHRHRAWRDARGRVVIEDHAIAGFGHGTPVTRHGDEACGEPGPHMMEAGISSTWRIAASWGIVPAVAPPRAQAAPRASAATGPAPGAFDPARVINDALRAAGLIRP